MRYLPPVLVLLVLFAVVVALMAWGWRRRARRQMAAGLPQPGEATRPDQDASGCPAASGIYVSTTLAQQPLERISAHGLGMRSRVHLIHESDGAGPGGRVDVLRDGARSFAIPDADIEDVTTSGGMIGKWTGGDGLLVIRWRLGDAHLETGFRLDDRHDHDRLLTALSRKDPA